VGHVSRRHFVCDKPFGRRYVIFENDASSRAQSWPVHTLAALESNPGYQEETLTSASTGRLATPSAAMSCRRLVDHNQQLDLDLEPKGS
jgi:hypothetical protein